MNGVKIGRKNADQQLAQKSIQKPVARRPPPVARRPLPAARRPLHGGLSKATDDLTLGPSHSHIQQNFAASCSSSCSFSRSACQFSGPVISL